jgi:hypothetical protein
MNILEFKKNSQKINNMYNQNIKESSNKRND